MTRVQLENKYGITIADDSYYSPFRNKIVKSYKIYSADGCCWEKGLSTIKAIEKECKEWEDALLSIYRQTMIEKYKRG